ncbi:MAG: hypothetical protein ABIR84_00670 [Candidatus Nitrotoga sp.]
MRNPKNVQPIIDKGHAKQGYELELVCEEHTYRRMSDDSWFRFSTEEYFFVLALGVDEQILKDARRAIHNLILR